MIPEEFYCYLILLALLLRRSRRPRVNLRAAAIVLDGLLNDFVTDAKGRATMFGRIRNSSITQCHHLRQLLCEMLIPAQRVGNLIHSHRLGHLPRKIVLAENLLVQKQHLLEAQGVTVA